LPKLGKGRCAKSGLQPTGTLSVQGVPIWQREIKASAIAPGTVNADGLKPSSRKILLIGGIHGDELTSIEIALRWLERVGEPEAKIHHWKFVPLLNPDGFFLDKPTRTNARGVDLNRNFPTPNWKTEAAKYWQVTTGKDPRRFPGTAPLSEPESKWLNGQLQSFKPDLVISIHAPLGVLDFDGPPPPPRRIGRLYLDQVGIYPGSLGNYSGVHRGVPVVTIELPNALDMPSAFEQDRMWRDMLLWLSTNMTPGAKAPATPASATSSPAKSALLGGMNDAKMR
jgi:murein peptide amidase A